MANAKKLWESFDDILANEEQWNQRRYITGTYRRATAIGECGTTQCLAGFRCLRDGLLPIRDRWSDDEVNSTCFVDPSDGTVWDAPDYAERAFELNGFDEMFNLFCYMTTDTAELKERIQEIIDGKYRDDESL